MHIFFYCIFFQTKVAALNYEMGQKLLKTLYNNSIYEII